MTVATLLTRPWAIARMTAHVSIYNPFCMARKLRRLHSSLILYVALQSIESVLCFLQMVARSKEDILKAKGVKPTLSPNLNTLATIEALNVKRLLFIGVGCQVPSLKSLAKNETKYKLLRIAKLC